MERPERGKGGRPVQLAVNYFPVKISDPEARIVHYSVQFEPPLPSNFVGRKLKSLLQEEIYDEFLAYDGNENLYMALRTAERQKASRALGPLRYNVCPWYLGKEHHMILTVLNVLQLSDLIAFCSGDRSVKVPRECVEALDTVLRDSASWVHWPVGKYIYWRGSEANPSLGTRDSVWGLGGFYQSLCAVEGGPALKLDASAVAFHGRTCVSHYLKGLGIELATLLRDEGTLASARRWLAGLYVDCAHQLHARRYQIVGISLKTAKDKELFDRARQRETSVAENFRRMYRPLKIDPSLPYLILHGAGVESQQADGPGPFLVPMDACMICAGQLFDGSLTNKEDEKLRALKGSNPARRLQAIMDGFAGVSHLLHKLDLIDGKHIRPIDPFGVAFGDGLLQTTGRVIPPPALQNVPSGCPLGGRWDLCRVYKSGRALSPQQWGIVLFSQREVLEKTRGLVDRVIEEARAVGVECFGRVQEETACKTLHFSLPSKPKDLLLSLLELKAGAWKDIVFLFCVFDECKGGTSLSSSSPLQMGSVARLCEAELGWLTKCCYLGHLEESRDHRRTVALMANAKLGGANTVLREDFGAAFRSVFRDDPVILFGTDVPLLPRDHLRKFADVAAVHRGEPAVPVLSNVAAVVASMDWPHPTQYCARVLPCPDPSAPNVPRRAASAMAELVGVHAKLNGGVGPARAVIFRHWVGDVEPWDSPEADMRALREAADAQLPNLKATWIDVRRKHHTKLFPRQDTSTAAVLNVEPGTVVDSRIVHPWQWDFYLSSHCATSATARVVNPTYYRVVRDDNGFTADDVEKFVYYLCHTFAGPTETTETVPPLYYAKLAAGYSSWTRSKPAGLPTGEVKDTMYFLN